MIQIKIGLTVRELRLKKELSQETLAFESDLHRTYIGAIERGERKITVATLKKITDALEIKLSEFMVLVEEKN